MEIIVNINDNSKNLSSFVSKYENSFKISETNLTPIAVSSIHLFHPSVTTVFTLFFSENACPHLHGFVSQFLVSVTQKEIEQIVNTKSFLRNLIKCHGTKSWCAHMTHVLIVLNRFPFKVPKHYEEKWKKFSQRVIPKIVLILEKQYGGALPQPISPPPVSESSDYSDDLSDE